MRRCVLLLLSSMALCGALTMTDAHARGPVRLVFDTDMGNDIDDALALGCIHALASRGECTLLAVTLTKSGKHSAPFCDLVDTFYGRGDVPIGCVRGGPTPKDGNYTRAVATANDGGKLRYPRKLASSKDAPEATALLRKVLAAQPDGSVVFVQVGFSTNLARLLDSKPDEHSPLTGLELVRKKARLLSAMAGSKRFPEYNVKMDIPAAKKVFGEWPTPIVVSPYEVGQAIKFPAASIESDFAYVPHHPLRDAYHAYKKMPYDRETWDLTSVLVAVRPDRGYFTLSEPGRVVVQDDGKIQFRQEPSGAHRLMSVTREQIVRVREALVMLASQPPG
jgi:inosine-uridine nucleoside N-ribohydrolase